MSDLDGPLGEFLDETRENLDRLDGDFVAIESNPGDGSNFLGIARALHTLKGTCGFFGFARLEALAHAGEGLLNRLRDGQVPADAASIGAMLSLVDAVRQLVDRIERTHEEGDFDPSAVIARLADLDAPGALAGVAPDPPTSAPGSRSQSPSAAGTVRIGVGLLDRLMDLAGELVLSRNQLMQHAAAIDDPALLGIFGRLNRVTNELQGGVMKARMQPIGTLWDKLPRVVRDVAQACGKRVRVEFEGRDTELDRSILEAIKDPLTHAVRNAVDHGIEAPAARLAAGKPAEGCLRLRATHEGGKVSIALEDDGAGIDPERVRLAASRRGVLSPEKADRLGDRELLQLLFLPGFSTAERVTRVSGRGVGMDVVKANVERVGGSVDLRSRPGRGTTLAFTIPLTLAIIPSLIVGEGDARYAIPQVAIRELVRVETGRAGTSIESVHGAPVYRLRGALLPLIELRRELDGASAGLLGACPEGRNIVVLRADGRDFGLAVGRVHDVEEIVVKPLGRHLKEIPIFSGATVLGDGKLALIVDVPGLARRAGLGAEAQGPGRRRGRRRPSRPPSSPSGGREVPRSLLLFGLVDGRRMALPIELVDRLADLPATAVERADGQEVFLHEGRLIPLVRPDGARGPADGVGVGGDLKLKVVICRDGDRRLGLAVDAIHDIVRTSSRVQPSGRRDGILGASLIDGRATDLIDLPGLIRASDPTFFGRPGPVAAEA